MRKLTLFFLLVCVCTSAQVDDSYTKVLLHFDGDFTDESGKTWTGFGDAAASTTQSKFGGSSLSLDSAGHLLASSAADFDFGGGAWTVDYWEYRTNTNNNGLLTREWNKAKPVWLIGYNTAPNTAIYSSSDAANWDVLDNLSMGTTAELAWHHRAVTYDGTNYRTFEDGAQVATAASVAALPAGSADVGLGVYNTTTKYRGYIDELRISKGIARWVVNFTPPTAEYAPAPAPVPTHFPVSLMAGGHIRFAPGGHLILVGD